MSVTSIPWQARDVALFDRVLRGFPVPEGTRFLGVVTPGAVPLDAHGAPPGPSGDRRRPTVLVTWALVYDGESLAFTFETGAPRRTGHLMIAVQTDPGPQSSYLAARVAGELGLYLDGLAGDELAVAGMAALPTGDAGLTDGGLYAESYRIPFALEAG